MSEHLRHSPESHGEANHELEKHKEALHAAAEKRAEHASHQHADNIGEIRSRIEAASKSKHEVDHHKKVEHEKRNSHHPAAINRDLKEIAYLRTMRRVQNKLPAPAKAFSKIVHNPVVETVSEVAGKTVARPSGILAGGIFAFLGSSLFLWITRHYGYEYNYLMFALFFIGGFFIGLLVELGLRLSNRRS